MRLFETPDGVASCLARWVPSTATSILEPSVGRGALLKPLVRRLQAQRAVVTCVDTTVQALQAARALLASRVAVRSFHGDFLSICRGPAFRTNQFDCVLMNPPFVGRPERLRTVPDCLKPLPVEAAFLLECVRLTRPGGRVLAVLPSSVVSGASCLQVREQLTRHGDVLNVHELPLSIFAGIEGRIFLLVYQKSKTSSKVVLCNHRLRCPDRLVVPQALSGHLLRWDYAFHRALERVSIARAKAKLTWVRLDRSASIVRGSLPGAVAKGGLGLHTVNASPFLWRAPRSSSGHRSHKDRVTHVGDILLPRVMRRCTELAGMAPPGTHRFSDCVLRIRPTGEVDGLQFLFSLRLLLSCGAGLLQRGVGASYVSVRQLASLEMPIDAARVFASAFQKYSAAAKDCDWDSMLKIESRVAPSVFGSS